MKKLRQLDYACMKGERVWWPEITGKRVEGVILDIKDDVAFVKLDNGTIEEIKC